MPDYSHWFPAYRCLTASQFTERARCLEIALERLGLDRPHQSVINTDPGHQFKAALTALFDRWTSRRRVEARSGLRAALAADDRRTIAALSRRADMALLGQLDRHLAYARDRAARLARVRPLHRMM